MIDYQELTPPEARPLEPLGLHDVFREGLEGSLAKANTFASVNRWTLALPWYYTTFQHSENPTERAEALLGQVEMGINLGRLGQAGEWLDQGLGLTGDLDPSQDMIFFVKRRIKLSKIYDRLGEFNYSLPLSSAAADQLTELDLDETDFQILSAEANLVMAKAHLAEGIVKFQPEAIKIARGMFDTELFRYETLMDQIQMGNQHLWLSKCDLVSEGYGPARRSSFNGKTILEQVVLDNPGSTAMYRYHQVRGEELLYQRLAEDFTLKEFAEAFRLTTQVEDNPLAASEAAYGLSKTLALMGKNQLAAGWSEFATTTYPQVLVRPFSG